MTAAETIAALRAKLDVATEGPWRWDNGRDWVGEIRAGGRCIADTRTLEDAAVIASAHNALPALLTALEDVLALVADGGDYHYSVADSADGGYVQEGQPCVPVDELLYAIEAALAEATS